MHCGHCGNTSVEVRPCYVGTDYGDCYLCQSCVVVLAPLNGDPGFISWLGWPCDECGTQAAFDLPISGLPDGIVCDECVHENHQVYSWLSDRSDETRGVWLCEDCYYKNHSGHKQKELIPILDRLAQLGTTTEESD
jgi:hypothetical protein